MIRTSIQGIILGAAVLASSNVYAAPNCFNVSQFTVTADDVDTKEEARAAAIPEHRLVQIQAAIVVELAKSFSGAKAYSSDSQKCPETAESIFIDGKITDFKKGNKALRYLVGFGAGAQKIQIMASLRSGDGKFTAEGEISDKKIGGLLGGSEDKGIQDFAEKVVDFVKESLATK